MGLKSNLYDYFIMSYSVLMMYYNYFIDCGSNIVFLYPTGAAVPAESPPKLQRQVCAGGEPVHHGGWLQLL